MAEPREEFLEIMEQSLRIQGFDDISAKLVSFLYLETKEISLDDLARSTGYSLSAVSTAMKFLVGVNFVRRSRKPGSRKVYFYMDKDLIATGVRMMKHKQEKVVQPLKAQMPSIIEKYENNPEHTSKEELAIIKDYYEQILDSESATNEFLQKLEEICQRRNK